jgi:hypothetical protein
MKYKIKKSKTKYIVLFQEGTCGHKHRHYGKAVDCYDRLSDNGYNATIAETRYNPDLLWIENCLLKHTSIAEMKSVLQS